MPAGLLTLTACRALVGGRDGGASGAAVTHSVAEGTKEVVVVDLARLGEELANGMQLLGGNASDFFRDLWDWPPYAGERTLKDDYRQTPPV